MRVWVPFRNRTVMGLVISAGEDNQNLPKLKSVLSIVDEQPILTQTMLKLCLWVAQYYQSFLSEVITLALPRKLRQGRLTELPQTQYYLLQEGDGQLNKNAPRLRDLLSFMQNQAQAVPRKLLLQQGFTGKQLNSLVDKNLLRCHSEIALPLHPLQGQEQPLQLNDEQACAVDTIRQHLHHYHCFLLQGITGSGKTEVYLQLISSVLAAGKQALILVPEIGLTPQLIARFQARFKEPIAAIHSSLNDTERHNAWQLTMENRVKLIIGTRSAIFTPMPELGLIIIDEEHDSSLKQMEGVRYSARDTALMRAYQANIPVILGSATPSLESLHNCQQQKYTRLRLNHKALTSSRLHFQLVDLRSLPMEQGLSAAALALIKEHLQQQNQVLVFINRRGFAPVLLCHECGWMADCQACDSHLTMHRQINTLVCHHCGLSRKIPQICGKCRSRELIPVGTGTQRLQEYLQSVFPDTCVLRIDRDVVSRKHELDKRLEQINSGEAQLIVGTQMLAKGHHFPQLTLVVIVDADSGLYNQDFRALEQLGQLLTQVAGRAGRAEKPGQVLIQTHQPQHPMLNLLVQQGYDAFAAEILASRAIAALPPCHHLAIIRAQDRQPAKVQNCLQHMKNFLSTENVQVFGPAPAPMPKKANQHRMQLLIKSSSRQRLQQVLTGLRANLAMDRRNNNIRWNIDVDPMDLS